jgi:UDP-2,4-diacetamido-2,4,6-trideoxy-beta-L-altropyranose hydrolase
MITTISSSTHGSVGGDQVDVGEAGEDQARLPPTVVFRADGGHQTGFGHLGRCVAVAQELGDEAAFDVGESTTAAWLAKQGARTVTAGTGGRTVVLDRVDPVPAAEVRALQTSGSRVCLVDDPGDGRSLAEVVIDPPTGPRWPPARGRRLEGFDHALLRREIRAAAANPMRGVGVMLVLGGSDPNNATPRVADAMIRRGTAVLSVLGPGYSGPQPAGRTLSDPADFARALAGADLVVCGFGHTLLEAAHLGVPAIALALRANDPQDAAAFAKHATMRWLDAAECIDADAVSAEAADLHGDEASRAAMSARGRELIDGRGAARVATVLRELV